MNQPPSLFLPDEAATLALGARLARGLVPGLMITLDGDLGAGKTTLVRGLLRALGDTGPVKSPTYTLVELHAVSGLDLYHFDFYRFNHPDEYLDAGLDEYFSGQGVCLVEWPALAVPHLPPADLEIRLTVREGGREARMSAASERGRLCLAAAGLTSSTTAGGASSGLPPPA
jgi:tRNA threonylcarbamoyladenosine biosynthesis protein TsaE